MNRPRLVPTEPLTEQPHPVLELLARLSKDASDAVEGSGQWTDLAPYQRARLRHLGVAIAATVANLGDTITGKTVR